MLTGQNYPDIVLMDRGNDIVNRYIEAGALLPLNDLIDGGRFGCAVKTGDVEDLAEAFLRICGTDSLFDSKRAKEAIAFAEKRFEWETIIEAFYPELKKLME